MSLEKVIEENTAAIKQLIAVMQSVNPQGVKTPPPGSAVQEKEPPKGKGVAETASSPSGAAQSSTAETGAQDAQTTNEPIAYKTLADKFIAVMNASSSVPAERKAWGSKILQKFGVANLAHIDKSRYTEVWGLLVAAEQE